jgi:cellulose synthase (UDP-forming)
VRLWTGAADSVIGTGVNVGWVAYDLLVLSVIWKAALYRGAPRQSISEKEHSL